MKRLFRLSRPGENARAQAQREIDQHIELRAQELIASGVSPDDARKAALDAFGDRASIEAEVGRVRDATIRDRDRRDWLGELRMDLVVGLRGFLRAPGFTVAALLTLAIGIGANTAIFSVFRSVLMRPLPYANAEQLVQIWADHRAIGRAEPEWLTPPDFLDIRDGNRTFSAVAAYSRFLPDLTGDGDPEGLAGMIVSGNYLELLGARPALGRLLTMADDNPAAERVVVLSDALWRRRFGADSSIVNRPITLNGQPWVVVGVLPRDFQPPFPGVVELFGTFSRPADSPCGRGCVTWRAIGRLRPGVALAAAQSDLGGIAARLAREYPETNEKVGAWLVPLHEQITGESKAAVLTLAGAVGLVLLIGCVNLAGLLLVRGAGRSRELSVRAALGAGRGRIVRQLLTEHALLAVVGGALGLALGVAASSVAGALVPDTIRRVQEIRVDPVVVLFAAGVTMLCAALFGLAPALYAVRANVMGVLRGGARSTRRAESRLRSGLVVAQLSIAVVLLVGAGLLMRSFLLMQGADVGYRTSGVLMTPMVFPPSRYPADQVVGASTALLERLRANPAVRAAELVDIAPLSVGDGDVDVTPVGEPERADLPPSIWMRATTPGYLSTMQFRLIAGRQFNADDRAGSALVTILNEEAARRYFPGSDPVGRELAIGSSGTLRAQIVGVVANDRHDGAREPVKVEMFVPHAQRGVRRVTLVVEPAGDTAGAVSAIRAAIRESDPLMPIGAVRSIDDLTRETMEQPRVYAVLVGAFAVVALLLAALGVYGVQAYSVVQREREIGVRLALGAAPSGIRNIILRDAARLAAIGLVTGLVAAVAAGRLAGALLYGVSAFDAPTFITVVVVLALVTLVAAWVPARRALRVDPLSSMRQE